MRSLSLRLRYLGRHLTRREGFQAKPVQRAAGNVRVFDIANIILIISILAAGFFLILTSRENTKLKREQARLASEILVLSGRLAGPPTAQVGDIVPPFEAVSLEGRQSQVVYDGSSSYLLYFFSPDCGVCLDQMATWNRIAAQVKVKNYITLGISLKSTELTNMRLKGTDRSFDILMIPNEATKRAYRVVAEPLVMIVSSGGTVNWVHYGALTEAKLSELLSEITSR
jgi:peroxiredoxin